MGSRVIYISSISSILHATQKFLVSLIRLSISISKAKQKQLKPKIGKILDLGQLSSFFQNVKGAYYFHFSS